MSAGSYQISALRQFYADGSTVQYWEYPERLVMHLIYRIIKPCFKYLISAACLHLRGPSMIKQATRQIRAALETNTYRYFIRLDIKSYYASIDRDILEEQVINSFDDPILLGYLKAIVQIPIDKDGVYYTPKKGIPRGSSLSPFFGALYLDQLDRAFDKNKNVLYIR